MYKANYSRRKFIGQLSCAAIGSNTFLNTLINLNLTNTLVAKRSLFNNDYKALVCVLFSGGNDSFNVLVPKGTDEYNEYQTVRSTLALNQADLLPITPKTNDGKSYGLHPAFSKVKTIFDDEKLAFVANVGTLHEPTNLADYNANRNLPLGLFSHSDQIRQWQTSLPADRDTLGWGGKMADVLASMNENSNISMNISLSGTNVFQSGNTASAYSINHKEDSGSDIHGSSGILAYDFGGTLHQSRTSGIDNVLAADYNNLMHITYKDALRGAQDKHIEFSSAIKNVANFATPFTSDVFSFSNNLKMVAKTIASRNVLNMNRQIFFVNFGGWDHHDEVLSNQQYMLSVVANGLSSFQNTVEELGLSDKVTLFTISDFGRTLSTNGNGSDHGWGGNHLVMGGAVKGQDIYGTYPDLYAGNSLDVGRGRLIPTMSTDEYFAELALWFGVEKSELGLVLPNIANFYNTANTTPPVGFMNI
ncbi:MAG: DUF1501 domain-containing protein [Bacteroidota bacterium]